MSSLHAGGSERAAGRGVEAQNRLGSLRPSSGVRGCSGLVRGFGALLKIIESVLSPFKALSA